MSFEPDNETRLLEKYDTSGLYQFYLFYTIIITPINGVNHNVAMFETARWGGRG